MSRAKLLLLPPVLLLMTGFPFAKSHGSITAGLRIDPEWLEDSRDMAGCTVCHMVLQQPTTGCPEGHALCRSCYVTELSQRQRCPLCQHPTKESRLQRCRPLEDLIGQLRLRCKHGKEGEGGGEDTNMEPLDEQCCNWRGKVCQLEGHLAESCGYESVPCPNAAAGCTELVLRKDAACHASGTCEYRQSKCAHCNALFNARDQHEGSCPEAQIECPNAGCGETVARRSMAEHRGLCGREEVQCPCPGCEERMARVEVGEHVKASGEVHMQRAWIWAAEMEDKVEEQAEDITALRKRGEALTRVFTWSTGSSWLQEKSLPYTFTDGVRGFCVNGANHDNSENFTHWIGFALSDGPECTMHFKCSILDKNDKVLRVVSRPEDADFLKPPGQTAEVMAAKSAEFNLTAADDAGAVRADGSIKLRMVVHLYLPE